MEFALSEEQELLVDSVSKMLSSSCNVDELRSQASGKKTFSNKVNKEFSEMGLNGLLVPEKLGGSGSNRGALNIASASGKLHLSETNLM